MKCTGCTPQLIRSNLFTFTENCKLNHFKVIITVLNEVLCKRNMLVIVQQGLDSGKC